MKCKECGAEINDNARFCQDCGAKVAADGEPPAEKRVAEAPKRTCITVYGYRESNLLFWQPKVKVYRDGELLGKVGRMEEMVVDGITRDTYLEFQIMDNEGIKKCLFLVSGVDPQDCQLSFLDQNLSAIAIKRTPSTRVQKKIRISRAGGQKKTQMSQTPGGTSGEVHGNRVGGGVAQTSVIPDATYALNETLDQRNSESWSRGCIMGVLMFVIIGIVIVLMLAK